MSENQYDRGLHPRREHKTHEADFLFRFVWRNSASQAQHDWSFEATNPTRISGHNYTVQTAVTEHVAGVNNKDSPYISTSHSILWILFFASRFIGWKSDVSSSELLGSEQSALCIYYR